MIKGIAVLMMLTHHLWGFPERVADLQLGGVYVQIGSACKMCVSIFMFLSGYGLYVTYRKKQTIDCPKRVWNTYRRFWQVMMVFVPLGLLFGCTFDLQEFISNALCLTCSYNHEWWFLSTYIELLIIFALLLPMAKSRFFSPLLVCMAVLMRVYADYSGNGGV